MSQSPFRGFCERLLGVWQYAQRPQRGAIVDGKPCITAGGAKRNLRGTDTSLSFGVEDVEQCCATSRHIIIGATSPQAAPLWACQRLSMVKRRRCLLYFPVMCNLRERRLTLPRVCLVVLPYAPTHPHHPIGDFCERSAGACRLHRAAGYEVKRNALQGDWRGIALQSVVLMMRAEV